MSSTLVRDVHERRFHVMGTRGHVVVTGGEPELVEAAEARLVDLEARWSRFVPHSELCQLNALAGEPVVVSPVTFMLIGLASAAWQWTGGLFDPTILHALMAEGYDASFEEIRAGISDAGPAPVEPAPGCGAIELNPLVSSVRVPAGVSLDLGGIAKGFAADLVALELLKHGAAGACVNLGGDLRTVGQPPEGDAWVIGVDAEMPGITTPTLAIASGGIATSSRARRTWRRGSRVTHHLIDPFAGHTASVAPVAATVVAGRAVDAEVLAKATLLEHSLEEAEVRLLEHDACALVLSAEGEWTSLGPTSAFVQR